MRGLGLTDFNSSTSSQDCRFRSRRPLGRDHIKGLVLAPVVYVVALFKPESLIPNTEHDCQLTTN